MRWMLNALMIGFLAIPAAALASDERWYPVHDTERIQRSLAFSGTGAKRFEVDNVWGSIQLAAYDGQTVEVSITRTLKARTQELLEQARKEVTLDVTEEPSLISLYVDGPFRDCDCDGPRFRRWRTQEPSRGRRSRGELGYVVQYDFVIKTPRAVSIGLSTVNNGDIHVDGIVGSFDVDNVNGKIDMANIAGSGHAHTVNGPVTVLFARNPTDASSFRSINGELIVYFDPSLQADLTLKTMNGQFYSDFDSAVLTATKPVAQRVDGGKKFVYKFDRGTGLRVGRGGPEIAFETLNGDIRILHRGR
jgi:hypothetical protein